MYSCSYCQWDGEMPILEKEKYMCPRCETEVQEQTETEEIHL